MARQTRPVHLGPIVLVGSERSRWPSVSSFPSAGARSRSHLFKVAAILLDAVGIPTGVGDRTLRDRSVVLAIRLPRALLGLAVGGGLAIAGAAMQGLFRNPLADPRSDRCVDRCSTWRRCRSSCLAGQWSAAWNNAVRPVGFLPLAAFAGGLLVTLIVQRIATQRRRDRHRHHAARRHRDQCARRRFARHLHLHQQRSAAAEN